MLRRKLIHEEYSDRQKKQNLPKQSKSGEEEKDARREREESKSVCKICQEPLFNYNDKVFALGTCNDVFHFECMKEWLKSCIEN